MLQTFLSLNKIATSMMASTAIATATIKDTQQQRQQPEKQQPSHAETMTERVKTVQGIISWRIVKIPRRF